MMNDAIRFSRLSLADKARAAPTMPKPANIWSNIFLEGKTYDQQNTNENNDHLQKIFKKHDNLITGTV